MKYEAEATHLQQGTDSPQGPPGTDPALAAPAGATEDGDKSNAVQGAGASGPEDAETEVRAAREAGEYAAAVAGVDPEAAAPIPADATEALATPGTGSSAPADSDPNSLTPDDLSESAGG
ncbi:MAG TPA: hypothetical protein VGX28_04845 [Frankiaceae bacterium]|jgi:hypothetical protein|nr:hypothetical protein [Frankiaceae bacterium]